jgi:hypothetical protein
MKAIDIFFENLILESNHNSLLLLDIDKTLVEAKNIFIYRNHPTDTEEVRLTPEEFAKDPIAEDKENKKYYDFREFRDPYKVAESIKTGLPIISNLRIMDNYIKNGWTIGVLTARGMEKVVSRTMKTWLKFKDFKTGKLRSTHRILLRKMVFAINDDTKKYKGESDFERKANVIKNLTNEFDRVWLIDDDMKNVNAVNNMAQKEGLQNKVKAMLAKP